MRKLLLSFILLVHFKISAQINLVKSYTGEEVVNYSDTNTNFIGTTPITTCFPTPGTGNINGNFIWIIDSYKDEFWKIRIDETDQETILLCTTVENKNNNYTNTICSQYITRYFFNNDDEFEYLKYFSNERKIKLMNNLKEVLFELDCESEPDNIYLYDSKDSHSKQMVFHYKKANESHNNQFHIDVYEIKEDITSTPNKIRCNSVSTISYPIKNNLILTYNLKDKKEAKVKIADISGKILIDYSLDTNLNRASIDVTNLSGNYIYIIYANNQIIHSDKIIISN